MTEEEGGRRTAVAVREVLRENPIRLLVIPALIVLATVGTLAVLLWAVVESGDRRTVATSTAPSIDDNPSCDGVEALYAVKGTDCRDLPVVTAPGALGPPNTGGPAGGTDWLPALPGSNVWIPEYQISGRLFVKMPGSPVPVPEGYEKIGPGPNGMVFYWRPDDIPPPA